MTRFIANIRFLAGTLACCMLLGATTAPAAIVVPGMTAVWNGTRVPGGSWAVKLDNTVNSNTNLAGEFQWSSQNPGVPNLVNGVDSLGNPVEGGSNFISFCIEITQTISPSTNPQTFDLIDVADAPVPGTVGTTNASPMEASGANAMAKLWKNFLDDALYAGPGSNLALTVGAFQLAVWKIAYDEGDTFDLSTGRLTASNLPGGTIASPITTIGSLAQQWLNAIAAMDQSAPPYGQGYLFALSKGNRTNQIINFQDQLVGTVPPPGSGNVPEATSVVIWGLLSSAVALIAARRQGS